MVAPIHFHRRWLIKNGTLPPGHPCADEPADGYYRSESDAKKAKKTMVSCYGISASKLIVACEDSSTRPSDTEPRPGDSPA
ncbi:MAG: hypothetical protein Q8N18_22410 [Opitutaceae bacterium]|nr:hypothetical protein [Opitutaceae bacterium]